jgi:murein L,D-transpeptidase YafK
MVLNGLFRSFRLVAAIIGLFALAACQADEMSSFVRGNAAAQAPVSRELRGLMAANHMDVTSPILLRIFKEENVLEVWKENQSGRYALLTSFEICAWSGELGPKMREGDRQAPEGFYTITPGLMNPNSGYYLAFNTGYPNAYDRANGRTGTHLMVHGACSSAGCYAMTDESIQDIYALAREAFRGGQRSFQLQAFPFRMTAENMGRHWDDENRPFWQMLKEGSDHFELTGVPPEVDVCGRRYVFNARPEDDTAMSPVAECPILHVPQELELRIAQRTQQDEAEAIQIAAVVREERRVEQEIMLAEAERQREIDERIEQARMETMIARGEVPAAAEPLVADNGQLLPRRDPREQPMLAMQAAPEPTLGFGFFTQLFGSDEEAAPVTAVATSQEIPALVPATITAEEAAAAMPAPQSDGVPQMAEPLTAGAIPQPAPALATASAETQPPGFFDRLTSWF